MALEGTLEDFSLADIFQLIGIQRKTGILTLKSGNETVSVTFHNGMVIGADSFPKKLEDRIGKVLVKTALISQDQLDEALEYQKKTMQKIGFILLDQHYLSKEQLKEALQIQVTQTIYRLFRWSSGEYYFDQKTKVDPNSDESIAPVSAESILMEGIHMIDEWPVIRKRIPDFQMVFRRTVQLEDLDLSSNNGNPADSESEKIRLGKEEQEVFYLVDGIRSVADVIESSKFGEFYTCKGLYDLLERKVIEPSGSIPVSRPISTPTFHSQPAKGNRIDYVKIAYVVLPILLLLILAMNLRDPLRLAVLHFTEQEDIDAVRSVVSRSRIRLLDSAVMMYYHVNGILPFRLEDLVEQRYIRMEDTRDPWSRSYLYEIAEGTYSIVGHNPAGEADPSMGIRRTVSKAEAVPPPRTNTSEEPIKFVNPE